MEFPLERDYRMEFPLEGIPEGGALSASIDNASLMWMVMMLLMCTG